MFYIMKKEEKKMKKFIVIAMFLALSIFSFANVLATPCDLQISMINQDPYPAIPGEEVKLVFQIDGLENSECGTVEFELMDNYPLTISPGQTRVHTIEAGIFEKDFESFYLASYKAILAQDTLNGEIPIEVRYKSGTNLGYTTKDFDLMIEDTRADFEVHIKDYNFATKILTFEILNIAENDVQALTVEIPKQDAIEVKGSNRNIVGDLDSNDYTTAEFEAIPQNADIEILIHYTDAINERRVIAEKVSFESNYFIRENENKISVSTYIFILIAIGIIAWWIIKRRKKKKAFEAKLKSRK